MTRRSSSSRVSTAAGSQVRQVLDSIRRVVRVLRLASRNSEKHVGLSSAQLFVLQRLAAEKSLSVNEVAERTHTHQSSVSVVVQRLVERGLVSRARSTRDARQMQLSVTSQGRAVLRAAPSAVQDQLITALTRMPIQRRRQLQVSLQHLVELLGADKGEPAVMLFEEDSETPKHLASRQADPGGDRKARRDGRPRNRT